MKKITLLFYNKFVKKPFYRLLLVAVVLLLASTTPSKAQKITMQVSNQTIEQVLETLKSKQGYSFIFKAKDIDLKQQVSHNFTGQSIQEILTVIFKDQPVTFQVTDKMVYINKVISVQQPSVIAQIPVEIKGNVKDQHGEVLTGVNIAIKGKSTGTISDIDGNFTIRAGKDEILIFNYVGYDKREIKAEGNTSLQIILKEQATNLEEVIVVGYGVQKKSDLTGAVSSVKADELVKTSDASIGQLLKGKAAGVTAISTSAQPGGGVNIRIRSGSINAGTNPLYVIDGFPVSGGSLEPGSPTSSYSQGDRSPLNSLNPNDIESIEILKDASSTAIYGARAANGVVIITTKRGKKGLKLNYDGNFTTQILKKPFEVFTAEEYMVETNKLLKEKWLRDNKIYPFGEKDPAAAGRPTQRYSEEQIAASGKGTNWWNEVTQQGLVQNHNVSINYGNEHLRTYASLGYFKNEGVVRGSAMERFSNKINLDWNINKYISVGMSYLGAIINNNNIQGGDGEWGDSNMIMTALLYDPTVPVKDEEGNYSEMSWYTNMPNPVSYSEVNDKTKQNRNLSNFFLQIEPLKGLILRTSIGYDGQSSVRKAYFPKTFMLGKQKDGLASIAQMNSEDLLFDATATYQFELKKHKFTLMGGYAYQDFNNDWYSMSGTKYFTDVFEYNNIGVGVDRPNIGSSKGQSVLASYFGRINYNFFERYLAVINLRYDGCDKFAKNHKWGFFPSASVGWRVSEEEFFKNLEWEKLSNLKLRISYGQTGNSNIGENAFRFYDVNRKYAYNSEPYWGVALGQVENDNLKWETTTEFNFGLDFGVFDNRISGTVEYFNRMVSDLLYSRDLRSWMVVSKVASNIGKTQSNGIEFTLNTNNIIRKNFTWDTGFTFTRYVTRWKERYPEVVLKPWEKVNDLTTAIFYYQTDGIVQIGESVPHMPNAIPGNIKVKDVNGFDENMNYTGGPDGKIDEADIVLLGDWEPGFSIGLNNTFKYRNFDLNIHCYGFFNQLRFNNTTIKYIGWSDKMIEHGTNLRVEARNRWSSDNTGGIYPSDAPNTTMGSDAYAYEDASFFRVKNITLGYTLPKKIMPKELSRVRLYIDAQNPFIITNWTGMDPETDGTLKAPYPNQYSFSLGLNLQF